MILELHLVVQRRVVLGRRVHVQRNRLLLLLLLVRELLEQFAMIVQFVLQRVIVVATLPFELRDALDQVVFLLFGSMQLIGQRAALGRQ